MRNFNKKIVDFKEIEVLLKGLKFRFELILLVTNLSGIKEIKVFLTMMNFKYMAKLFLWRFMH